MAKVACAGTGEDVDDHFHHVVKMVSLGSGSERATDDIELTRFHIPPSTLRDWEQGRCEPDAAALAGAAALDGLAHI